MDLQSKWNKRYGADAEYVYGTAPNDFLQSVAHLLNQSSHILCLAEGEGRNAVFLAQQGHTVSALDLSIEGKQKAQGLAKEKGVAIDYAVCDMNDYDFGENKWDAIVSIFAHTDPTTRHAVWQRITKALKKGGLFIVESYHPKQIQLAYGTGGPTDIEFLVTLDELKTFFKDFEILHQQELEREVKEGLFHTGKAYVTQFVCRR